MSLLAGLRERRRIGAVVVERDDARERVAILEEVTEAMVGCVRALVLDLDEIGAADVRAGLAETVDRLRGHVAPNQLAEQATRCQHDTLEFAERERDYLDRRDDELRRIIGVLTDGLAAVGSGSAAYHQRLLAKGSRLEAAARLDDLVKVRAAIATEVQALRAEVAERQVVEQRATAALRTEVETLRASVAKARTEARTDPLTGAANRAAFDDELSRRCPLAAAGGDGFALIMVDVDHFKAVNDQHGHAVGDRVLTGLVAFLRPRVRRDDLIARWGGEEFAVVLPGASTRVALKKARTVLRELAGTDWTIDGGRTIRFTVSAGVAVWKSGDEPDTITERADRALYKAKHAGRNRAERG